jgi:hypothetical protein
MAFGECSKERKSWLTNWMKERKKAGLPEELLYKEGTKKITIRVRTRSFLRLTFL